MQKTDKRYLSISQKSNCSIGGIPIIQSMKIFLIVWGIMFLLSGCVSVNTKIVGQTHVPVEPTKVNVFTLKEFFDIILEKRKCEQLAYIKIKNIPRKQNSLDYASNEASKIGANYIAVVAYYNHYLGGDHIEVNAYKCSEIKSEIVDDKKLI